MASCRSCGCDASFDSERARSIHESKKHGGVGDNSWKDREYLEREYAVKGRSMKDIADEHDVPYNRVRSAIHEFDIETRGSNETRYYDRRKMLRESIEDIKNRYVENKEPAYKIAEDYGVTDATITRLLKESGVEVRDIQQQHVANSDYPKLHDRKWLKKQYRQKERYAPELAEELGCSVGAVKKALEKYDIETFDHGETISGEKNPNWKGGTEAKPCDYCGEEYQSRVYQQNDRFCCNQCFWQWRSENLVGPQATNWRGGHPSVYLGRWQHYRQKRLEKDSYECVICSMSQEAHRKQYNRSLEVHHIIPYRTFDEPEEANQLGNLITLCCSCHVEWEGIPVVPQC